jgi:hypothetical protein
MVDSRPFQIFEGSNDILYQQISESVLKMMRRSKETNLYKFLKSYSLTENSAEYFKDILNFEIDTRNGSAEIGTTWPRTGQNRINGDDIETW